MLTSKPIWVAVAAITGTTITHIAAVDQQHRQTGIAANRKKKKQPSNLSIKNKQNA